MKLKPEFYNSLFQQLDNELIDFWCIRPHEKHQGVIRTRAMDNRIKCVYLVIHTFDYDENNPPGVEWIRFNVIEGIYELDSIYSKRNLWGLPDADEYRYTVDQNRDIIATYKYLTKNKLTSIGDPIAEQIKNREKSYYMLGAPAIPPNTVIHFDGVECEHPAHLLNWIDSDGDTHWWLDDEPSAKYTAVCLNLPELLD